MLYSRLGRLAILSLLLVPSGVLLAQERELTTEQVQQILEQQVPAEPVFVPGQIIVKMSDDAAMPAGALQGMGLDTTVVAISASEFIYQIPPDDVGIMAVEDVQESTAAIARQLEARPDIEYAELNQYNYIVSDPFVSVPDAAVRPMSLTTPTDPRYSDQWHYRNNGTGTGESPGGINLPDAWDVTRGDASIVVSVLDTGILPNHADANASNLVTGFDMISNTFISNDGDGRDADPTDPGDAINANECSPPAPPHGPRQDSWHGTHVAGTIGFVRTNDNTGVAGVNWTVSVQPVRVLGKCGGTTADIAAAIRWAAGLPVPGVQANATPASVINMSLGGGGACSSAYQTAIDDAVNAGVTVVVAAGNSAMNASGFQPANCNNVVTVAASDHQGHLATRYSNFGATVEIMAPGGDVVPTQSNGVLSTTGRGYEYYNGTSMAAPHVAGVLALWLADDPTLTRAGLENRIQTTAMPRNSTQCPTNRPCGAGLIDANQWGGPIPSPPLTVTVALDPNIKIPNGLETDAVATVMRGSTPAAGINMTFAMTSTSKAEVVDFPPTATTDANGRARVRIRGVASRGRTEVTATTPTGEDGSATVRVPDLSLVGLALLIALVMGVEVRRRRAGFAGR